METFKQGEVTARIDERGIDLGNINVNLYTMDNSTSVLDIHIKKRNIFSEEKEFIPVNLNQTTFKPVLHLITEDNSIFTNEELEIVKAEEGHVRYNVSDYVTKHVGRVQAKLFLIDEDSSTDDSSHVADFYFKVNDSGLTKAIGKEIHVDMLDDIVERIMLKDIERFRGPKGDKGDTGPQGPKGDKGADGINGEMGPVGPTGPMGIKGDTGEKGDKGDVGERGPQGIPGPQGEQGPKGDIGEQGPIGPKGDKGANGVDGEIGPAGPRGADGVIKFDNLTETQKADLRSGVNYDLAKNISDLEIKMKAIDGNFFRLPVYTPKDFDLTDYPLKNKIFTNGRGQFSVDYDVSKNKLQNGNTYYIDYIHGSDDNDGTNKTKAFKSINYATDKVQDNDTLVLCEGTHFRSGGSLFPKPSSKSINIIGENSNVNVVWADEPDWQKTSNMNNVYETVRSNVADVIDIKNKQSLKKVNSISEVDSTDSSWYTDNTKVYVNCGFVPDELIAPILKGSSIQFNNILTDLYIENVNFIGGNNVLQIDLVQNNNLYLKNVSLSFGNYLYNGLTVTGGKNVIVQNCQAYNNGYDGFNYHVGKDQSLPLITEINCMAFENGSDKGTSGFKSNNGTTTHDGITSIRVNGVYARNDGGNVADVNEGTKSWNIGCSAFESYQGKDFQTASGSDMWLENCIAYGSENSINSYDENSVIYTRSGDFKNKLIIGKEIKY